MNESESSNALLYRKIIVVLLTATTFCCSHLLIPETFIFDLLGCLNKNIINVGM